MRLPFRRLTLLLLIVCGCRSAEPPRANSAVILETAVPTPPRKGVEPRARYESFLKDAPVYGLLLTSNGLVNETFRISVDFDTRALVHVTKFASEFPDETHTRVLTRDEIESLRADRERVWQRWSPLEKNPAAEYQETLYLLDGDQTTVIGAQGGFSGHPDDTQDAIAFARRLIDLK